MPYYLPDTKDMLQAFVSTYTINSFFYSLLQVHPINMWLPSEETGVTCVMLAPLFQSLPIKYGASTPVDIFVNVTYIGNVSFTNASQIFDALVNVDLQFWPKPEGEESVDAVWLTLEGVDIGA